jgi:hypothetical protein
MDDRIELLKELATQFRDAIESAKKAGERKEDFFFHIFPRGCCGDASDLLAYFFASKGIYSKYICGTWWNYDTADSQSHAWLLVDDKVVVDITGDQFQDEEIFLNYNKRVYIGHGDAFHDLFEVDPHDIRDYKGYSILDHRQYAIYCSIIKYIER